MKLAYLTILICLSIASMPVHAQNPRTAENFVDRGLERQSKGDLDGAIADYSKALEQNPKYSEAFIIVVLLCRRSRTSTMRSKITQGLSSWRRNLATPTSIAVRQSKAERISTGRLPTMMQRCN